MSKYFSRRKRSFALNLKPSVKYKAGAKRRVFLPYVRILFYGACWLLSPAYGQTTLSYQTNPPATTAEEGLRRQEERARDQLEKQRVAPTTLRPDAPSLDIDKLPDETPCFPIHEIRFLGPDARRFAWLQQEVQTFLGRCVGVNGVAYLASILDAKLIEFGYATTKVTLPEQNLADGILSFKVHVGRIERVRMVKAGGDNAPDGAWGTWWNAFPNGDGDILNIRDLEQGVEQMQRLPSQAVRTRIEPGSMADTSVVIIERETANRIRGGITLDNSGSETLGRGQGSGYLAIDNPLGLNDLLSLNANSNLKNPGADHRSQALSLSYSIPFGYNTLSFSKSYSRFAQVVQGTTVRFLSSGESTTDEVRLHHTVLRSASAKLGAYAALSTRRARSYLDDVELLVQRRRTTNFEIGATLRKLIDNADLSAEIGYRRGVPWRDAQEDLPEESGLTLRPRIWAASLSLNTPFSVNDVVFLYSASLHAQHTSDASLSIDQIAIGNRYNVRGFDGDTVLLAESGYFFRNEFGKTINLIDRVPSQVYVGIDFGRVWGSSDNTLIGNELAGAVIGLRCQWRGLQLDLALGTPLYKPSGFQANHVNPYLTASYLF